MKKKVLLIGVMLIISFILSGCGEEKKNDETSSDTAWREGGVWDVLPQPDTDNWELSVETDTYLSIDVKGDKEDFDKYVNKCREAGFDVDLYSSDGYYSALNEEGYFVDASLYEDDGKYSISIDDRRNQSEPEASVPITESSGETTSSEGVTPEFKEAMDSYEAFFVEYTEFMKEYNSTDDPMSLMDDYTEYMDKYTETMTKMEEIDENSLSDADLQYYTEVNTRIASMLAEVASGM